MTFSKHEPTMRLVWDATSLDAFMKDPLSYYWRYVEGWKESEPNVDLLWGTAWDKSMAHYHRTRALGFPRDQMVESTVAFAIAHSQSVDLDGAAIESKNKANKKNMSTLIRSIVWYDDEFGDYPNFEPIIEDKTLMVCPLGIQNAYAEEYEIVGNFDLVVRTHSTGKILVVERKTTSTTISKHYWLSYDPSVQLNTYDWMAAKYLDTSKLSGVLIEAVQTAVGFSRFAQHEVMRTPQQREHWHKVMCFWVKFAEAIALSNAWEEAMNLATQRWNSTARNIQRRTPEVWEGLLRSELEQKTPWNPLKI